MRFRSLLYVPGDNCRFIEKAHTRGADAIIIDLEDSVRPENKDAARENLVQSVALAGQNNARVFIRINSESDLALEDASAACRSGAFGLYVTKSSPEKLAALHQHQSKMSTQPMPLVALIESPRGVLTADLIARQPGVIGMSLGGEDFALEIGAAPVSEVLRVPRLLVHYAAKANQKLSFGLFQSTADFSDLAALSASAKEAALHGFDGATCVHPDAVHILNSAFSPTEEELAWATSVLAAAKSSASGAFRFAGKMVDAPVLARAQNILDRCT